MEQIRSRVESMVADKATAEALKPYYRQFCKRPCFRDDYLATFNRPNVTLVNTDGKGVDKITETSVWVNGEEYEVDCLIYATGFEVGTEYARRSGYELHGRDGVSLTQHWADGVTEEAQTEWVKTILSMAIQREKFAAECTPGYYNNEGKPNPKAIQNSPYGAGPIAFVKVLEDWRAEGDMTGLEVRRD